MSNNLKDLIQMATVNINFTLITLRDHLLKNVEIVNKLLENTENITDINPVGINTIGIKINSNTTSQKMLEEGVIVDHIHFQDSDSSTDSNLIFSDDDKETNTDRLAIINNLTNTDNSKYIFSEYSNDDSNESDQKDILIDDKQNIKNILDKYANIIQQTEDSDESKSDNSN